MWIGETLMPSRVRVASAFLKDHPSSLSHCVTIQICSGGGSVLSPSHTTCTSFLGKVFPEPKKTIVDNPFSMLQAFPWGISLNQNCSTGPLIVALWSSTALK